MNWVNKLLPPKIKRADGQRKNALPEGLWCKCPNCEAVLYTADLEANMQVCPKCNHHHRLKARARLDMLMDAHGRAEIGADVRPTDALKFVDSRPYPVRVEEAQSRRARPIRWSLCKGRSMQSRLWLPASNSSSWVAPWVLCWVSALYAACALRSKIKRVLSVLRPRAAPACRKVCFR